MRNGWPPDGAAAGRRRRRIEEAPAPLQPALRSFEAAMIDNRERARRAGTKPRTDATIETALATIRDLACFLDQQRKLDWALVDVHDVEAFLAVQPKNRGRRLVVLRQFFRHARQHRLLLTDPTRESPPSLAAASPAKPSPSPGNGPCSPAGLLIRAPTRTKPFSGCLPCFTRPPAWK